MIDLRGTTELVQHFCFLGGVHIGARALLDINLIWFGYTLGYPTGEEGDIFTRSNDFYLRLEGGGGSAPRDLDTHES
jgi:hypothetical protein